jgi:hypothetical protein
MEQEYKRLARQKDSQLRKVWHNSAPLQLCRESNSACAAGSAWL